jgi:hypothetical protein
MFTLVGNFARSQFSGSSVRALSNAVTLRAAGKRRNGAAPVVYQQTSESGTAQYTANPNPRSVQLTLVFTDNVPISPATVNAYNISTGWDGKTADSLFVAGIRQTLSNGGRTLTVTYTLRASSGGSVRNGLYTFTLGSRPVQNIFGVCASPALEGSPAHQFHLEVFNPSLGAGHPSSLNWSGSSHRSRGCTSAAMCS